MTTNGKNGKNGNSHAEGVVDLEATRARTDALYRQHSRTVWRICRGLLRDRAEAEDATQQVFLSAHRALLSGMVPYEPAAWLAMIARRECWARVAAHTSTLPPEAADGVASDIASDALRRAELTVMWTAIAELPSMQRDAFLLREIRGLSYGQLEQQLDRSEPSVRSLLGRARRRLRLRLQDVHTALGGVTWLEPVERLFAGGSNPAAPAVRAAAIGLGAAAIAGGAVVTPTVLEHHVLPPAAHAAARPARVSSNVHASRRAAPRVAPKAPRATVVFRRFVHRRSTHAASRPDGRTEHARTEVENSGEHEGSSGQGQASTVTIAAGSNSGSGSGDHSGETTTSHEGSNASATAIVAPSSSSGGSGDSGDRSGESGGSGGSGDSGGSRVSGDSGDSGRD